MPYLYVLGICKSWYHLTDNFSVFKKNIFFKRGSKNFLTPRLELPKTVGTPLKKLGCLRWNWDTLFALWLWQKLDIVGMILTICHKKANIFSFFIDFHSQLLIFHVLLYWRWQKKSKERKRRRWMTCSC